MKTPRSSFRLKTLGVAVLLAIAPVAEATLYGPPVSSRGGLRWQVGVSVGGGSHRGHGPYRGGHGPYRSGYRGGYHGGGRGFHDPFYAGVRSWRHDPFYSPAWGGLGWAWGGRFDSNFGYNRYGRYERHGWSDTRVIFAPRTVAVVSGPGQVRMPGRSTLRVNGVTQARDDLRDARSPEQLRTIYGEQAAGLTR